MSNQNEKQIQRIENAVTAGLALTDPESDLLEVFRKQATGVLLLRSLLSQIGNGEIALLPKHELDELMSRPPAPEPEDD